MLSINHRKYYFAGNNLSLDFVIPNTAIAQSLYSQWFVYLRNATGKTSNLF